MPAVMKKFAAILAIASAGLISGNALVQAQPVPNSTIAIGDSVMLGAKSALKAAGIKNVDAVVGRQAQDAGPLVQSIKPLPTTVVVNLGANGPFTLYHCKQILEALGTTRHLYLVTVKVPRSWEQQSNDAIHLCAKQYPQRVTLVDWKAQANSHASWFGKDGLHLDAAGAKAYASLIAKALQSRV